MDNNSKNSTEDAKNSTEDAKNITEDAKNITEDVHVLLDEPFLRWAHTKLSYPSLRHTVFQLQQASMLDLGTMWQIYKGADLPTPHRIRLANETFTSNYKTCYQCGAQIIQGRYSFNECKCHYSKRLQKQMGDRRSTMERIAPDNLECIKNMYK